MSADWSTIKIKEAVSDATPVAVLNPVLVFSSSEKKITKDLIEKNMEELMQITENLRAVANLHDCISPYDIFQVVFSIKTGIFDPLKEKLKALEIDRQSIVKSTSSKILTRAQFVFSGFREIPEKKEDAEPSAEGDLVKIRKLQNSLEKIVKDFASLIAYTKFEEIRATIKIYMKDALENKNENERRKKF